MSRHPQREPPPGYIVAQLIIGAWWVYRGNAFTGLRCVAGPYTRRYNAVAAAQRAYDRSQQAEQSPDRVE